MFQVLWKEIITNTERVPLFKKPPKGHQKPKKCVLLYWRFFLNVYIKAQEYDLAIFAVKNHKQMWKCASIGELPVSPHTEECPFSLPLSCPLPLFVAAWVGQGERKDSALETIYCGHFSEIQQILTLSAFNLEDLAWMQPMSSLANVRTEA